MLTVLPLIKNAFFVFSLESTVPVASQNRFDTISILLIFPKVTIGLRDFQLFAAESIRQSAHVKEG